MDTNVVSRFIQSLSTAFASDDALFNSRMVERDNVGVLQRIYQLLLDRKYEALSEFLADDVELEIIGPAVVPFVGKWQGMRPVIQAIQQNFTFVRNQRPEIVNLTAQGNSIVVVARERGESVQTGKSYDIHWVQIFHFRDGKLRRIHEVADGLDLALAFIE